MSKKTLIPVYLIDPNNPSFKLEFKSNKKRKEYRDDNPELINYKPKRPKKAKRGK